MVVSSLPPRAVRFARVLSRRLDWLVLLLIRLTLGGVFLPSGWGKVHHLDKVTAFFSELGIPWPAAQAVLVGYVELVGGLLVLVGLGARLAALPLAATMGVAILTAKLGDVHGVADLLGLGEFAYLVMLLAVAILGPGAASLDHVAVSRLPAEPFGSLAPASAGREA